MNKHNYGVEKISLNTSIPKTPDEIVLFFDKLSIDFGKEILVELANKIKVGGFKNGFLKRNTSRISFYFDRNFGSKLSSRYFGSIKKNE